MDATTTAHRRSKMASILQQELNRSIAKHVQWKPGILITVTKVVVTTDLQYADAYVSVLPEGERNYVMRTLEHEQRVVQQELFSRLGKKVTPTVRYVSDQGGEQQSRIDQLLDTINVAAPSTMEAASTEEEESRPQER